MTDLAESSRISPVSTWTLLQDIGFVRDTDARMGPGLVFSFGNFVVRAHEAMTSRFVPSIVLHGVFRTAREISQLEDQLPQQVGSHELGLALLAYCIDKTTDGRLDVVPAWLEEGRTHRHLLPWEQSMAAYRARPRCYVPRDWARMALKDLTAHVTGLSDDDVVTFAFDGRILTITCPGKLIPLQAEGEPWTQAFHLQAGAIRDLPKRLMRDPVEFSTEEHSIMFGGRRYPGFKEAPGIPADTSSSPASGNSPELGEAPCPDESAGQ